MKIPLSIREKYEVLKEDYDRLKEKIDESFRNSIRDDWFYKSRVKTLESFTQKLETGRYKSPRLEDFFACTIVVPNIKSLDDTKKFVENFCEIKYRRPEKDDETKKRPDSFPFDDIRLYVTYKDDPTLPPSGLSHFKFEIQIKTFLQHAWSIATHDLVYKTDTISWAKSRIAYQIKAMLEHAEISIQEAEKLSETPELSKKFYLNEELLAVVSFLRAIWMPEDLPNNILRLAESLNDLVKELKITLEDLNNLIILENAEERGVKTLNLSPYGVIVQSLFNRKPELMKELIVDSTRKFKLLIPREIELPNSIHKNEIVNGLLIN